MTKTHVFFGVFEFGDDLDAVTSIMGVEPSASWLRGEPVPPHPRARRTHSRWALQSGLPPTSAFEEQLSALLDKLEPLADGVRRVASRFTALVWAAIYTDDRNPVLHVSASAAGRLARLGLGIDFDVYHLSVEDDSRENPPSNSTQGPTSCDQGNRES